MLVVREHGTLCESANSLFQITKSKDLSEDLSQDIFVKLYL